MPKAPPSQPHGTPGGTEANPRGTPHRALRPQATAERTPSGSEPHPHTAKPQRGWAPRNAFMTDAMPKSVGADAKNKKTKTYAKGGFAPACMVLVFYFLRLHSTPLGVAPDIYAFLGTPVTLRLRCVWVWLTAAGCSLRWPAV